LKEASKLHAPKLKVVESDIPESPPELFTQRKREEVGRYRLLVDRQLKQSFVSIADAEAAGMAIKTKHPIVQVAIYDVKDGVDRIIEIPKAE
jgi:hypothetical protein